MTTTASPANYQLELNTTNGVLFQADSLPLAEADPSTLGLIFRIIFPGFLSIQK